MDATHHASFPATQWTEVVRVCREEDGDHRQRAVAELCRAYWYPLYAFARRLGRSRHDAEDLTQGFFCHVLERNVFSLADRDLGRLRTYLISVFKRYIGDVDARAQALKRGGGQVVLSLNADEGEQKYVEEPAAIDTPESLYERTWALTVLQGALTRLGNSERAAGQSRQFEVLSPHLNPDSEATGGTGTNYSDAADALQTSQENVRQLVSRLRKRYRNSLREHIAATLHDPSEEQIDQEVAALKVALRRG